MSPKAGLFRIATTRCIHPRQLIVALHARVKDNVALLAHQGHQMVRSWLSFVLATAKLTAPLGHRLSN